MDILYDWAEMPITVNVIGETAEVVEPSLIIDGFGELTPDAGGYERVVRFYTDLGWRTVALRHISVR